MSAAVPSFAPAGRPDRRRSLLGFTTVETLVTLGIAGILGLAGLSLLDLGSVDLLVAQQDLQGCLEQAVFQARAMGRPVTVAPAGEGGGPGIIPVRLPRKVSWGKPPRIPMPPGMDPTVRAASAGEAHPRITITPRRTATASAWFLNDGREAVCFRLSGHGHLQVLRYRLRSLRWERVG
ncbi:MAG: hypothetical protein HY823_04565 [Acidobacteria bacterium]|nr:hypothetical protein [Acidobacteriota bacterium]